MVNFKNKNLAMREKVTGYLKTSVYGGAPICLFVQQNNNSSSHELPSLAL